MERIPSSVLEKDILTRLELDTLSSLSCVSKVLHFSVSQFLLTHSSLFFPTTLSPDEHTVNSIVDKCNKPLTSVTLCCLNLYHHSSICNILGPHLLDLTLFCCYSFSSSIIMDIVRYCPNLRLLTLELAYHDEPPIPHFQSISQLLHLDTLCLKKRGLIAGESCLANLKLPKSIKVLKLEKVLESNAIQLVNELCVDGLNNLTSPLTRVSRLSLVLDVISDRLLGTIVDCLPLLIELDLVDEPNEEPLAENDLTNTGVQLLSSCSHLTSLSLTRVGRHCRVSFKRVNDMSLFLLSEGCKSLETVKLCGFSKITDAGFASILNSCKKLKKFEVRNAHLLSDLAFHGLTEDLSGLIEVKLLSCSLITSETVQQMASSRNLEVLDLGCCRSIADSSFYSISCLHKLTTLVLSGSDITDKGLSFLGQANLPIAKLSLRGCKRLTDKGISHLLHGSGNIGKSLSSLDLGFMRGISDRSILMIAATCTEITELCIRSCFYVTDSSLEALAKSKLQGGLKLLRWLDLYQCTALSAESLKWLRKGSSSIHGLHWLGVGKTRIASEGNDGLIEIEKERPWMIVCTNGCELGCLNGWQFHKKRVHGKKKTRPVIST
ncbi:hypothetical protein ACFE04_024861 [Oxalis oulophora]